MYQVLLLAVGEKIFGTELMYDVSKTVERKDVGRNIKEDLLGSIVECFMVRIIYVDSEVISHVNFSLKSYMIKLQ